MNENSLKQVIESSLENLKQVIDVDNVIGTPIPLDGDGVVIPVSKVALGYTSGGVDFDGKKTGREHFGGGSGAGMTIQPIAFLVVRGDDVRLLSVNQENVGIVGTVNELIDRAPSFVQKCRDFFGSKKKKNADDEEEDILSE